MRNASWSDWKRDPSPACGMSDYSVVFTGTQAGMTNEQSRNVAKALTKTRRMFNGLCIGADEEAHEIFRLIHGEHGTVIGFPSTIQGKCVDLTVDAIHPPANPLERNRTMVDEAIRAGNPLCVAAPRAMGEELRSGTWATVRYARKRNVPVFVCWPDGTTTWEPAKQEVA